MSFQGGTELRPVPGVMNASPGLRIGRTPRLVRHHGTMPERVGARRPDGSLLTLGDLPTDGQRWTRRRKRAVIECIECGLIGAAAVCRRYGLSPSELDEWRAGVSSGDRHPVIWRDRPRQRTTGIVTTGRLAIDLDAGHATLSGHRIELSPSEWRILAALAEADGALVSTAMIMGVLYAGPENAAGPKIADVLLCRLRKKLGPAGDRVAAVWGRGYCLVP